MNIFYLLVFWGSLVALSCSDACKDEDCVNGHCIDHRCICDLGYEGNDCSIPFNAKFSGSYSFSETCSASGSTSYVVIMAPKSGTIDEANITGLWEDPQATVIASVDSSGTRFNIARQALGTTGNDIESANGYISLDGSSVTLAYTVLNGTSVVETCLGSMTK